MHIPQCPRKEQTVPNRLNRMTRMIVMVAGLVLIGGSAVGGIAFAASRGDNSPASIQPHTTPSAGDRGDEQGDDNNKQDATATPKASCTEDRDEDAMETAGTGDRHDDATTHEDADGHHSGATPTATGTHHDDGEHHDTGAETDNDCDD